MMTHFLPTMVNDTGSKFLELNFSICRIYIFVKIAEKYCAELPWFLTKMMNEALESSQREELLLFDSYGVNIDIDDSNGINNT